MTKTTANDQRSASAYLDLRIRVDEHMEDLFVELQALPRGVRARELLTWARIGKRLNRGFADLTVDRGHALPTAAPGMPAEVQSAGASTGPYHMEVSPQPGPTPEDFELHGFSRMKPPPVSAAV